MLKDISNSFCIHCCGAEKKFECDTQERTCLKLAQFLIDCNKTINKKQRGVYTPEDLLPQTKYTPEYIDSLVGTESTLSPADEQEIDKYCDDLALNDMADAAFKERTADISIQILSDSSFFFKEGFVAGYNKAKGE